MTDDAPEGARTTGGDGREPFPLDAAAPGRDSTETATFGLGCFWGPDARFGVLPGVVRTRVGYAGGTAPDPSYRDLGDHTEVVQVEYDPTELDYEDLLELFWRSHNPRERSPVRQYDTVALAADADQRAALEASAERRRERYGRVTTRIEPLDAFHRAEEYHQKYHLRGHDLFAAFADLSDSALADSTVAARANGYVAGYGTPEQLHREIESFGLDAADAERLRERVSVRG